MKTTVSEMKTSLDGSNSSSDDAGRKIIEREVRAVETIQTEAQKGKKKKLEKNGQKLSDLWDVVNQSNKGTFGFPKGKEREGEIEKENIFEEVMAEKFQSW